MRLVVILAVSLCTVVVQGQATVDRAQRETTTLDAALSVPEDATCLTRAALVEHTATWLGTDRIDARQTILIELSDGERRDVGFVLLRAGQARARRRFAQLPAACADRRAALSLALAIALDASVLERLSAPASPIAPADVSAAPAPPAPAVSAPVASPLSARWGLRVGLALGVEVGSLPRPSALGGLDIALARPGWELRVGVVATVASDAPLLDGGVRTQLVSGGVAGCLDRGVGAVEFAGCFGPRVGRVWGRGRGFATSLTTRLPWVALAAGLEVRWPRASVVSLRARASGQLVLVRPTLRVRDEGGGVVGLREFSPAGFLAGAGVVLALR